MSVCNTDEDILTSLQTSNRLILALELIALRDNRWNIAASFAVSIDRLHFCLLA